MDYLSRIASLGQNKAGRGDVLGQINRSRSRLSDKRLKSTDGSSRQFGEFNLTSPVSENVITKTKKAPICSPACQEFLKCQQQTYL